MLPMTSGMTSTSAVLFSLSAFSFPLLLRFLWCVNLYRQSRQIPAPLSSACGSVRCMMRRIVLPARRDRD